MLALAGTLEGKAGRVGDDAGIGVEDVGPGGGGGGGGAGTDPVTADVGEGPVPVHSVYGHTVVYKEIVSVVTCPMWHSVTVGWQDVTV